MLACSWYVLLNYCSDREGIATEWQVSPEDPGKRQIGVCHRTTATFVSLIIRKKTVLMCRSDVEQEAEQWAFEAFFPGFLGIPKSQPCVRGTCRAVPGYVCSPSRQTPERKDLLCSLSTDALCTSSKAILLGLYEMYCAMA